MDPLQLDGIYKHLNFEKQYNRDVYRSVRLNIKGKCIILEIGKRWSFFFTITVSCKDVGNVAYAIDSQSISKKRLFLNFTLIFVCKLTGKRLVRKVIIEIIKNA